MILETTPARQCRKVKAAAQRLIHSHRNLPRQRVKITEEKRIWQLAPHSRFTVRRLHVHLHHLRLQVKKLMHRVTVKKPMKRLYQPVGQSKNLNVIFADIVAVPKMVFHYIWTNTPEQSRSNVNTVQKHFHALLLFICIAKHISHQLSDVIIVPKCLP